MEIGMSTPDNSDRNNDMPVPAGGEDNRSDNLLPGDEGVEDGRFDVAEEVNLDQQSDEARRIGQAPSQGIADAVPEALRTPVPSQQVPGKS
jgi:hypothetical protein